jgi:hypothetical protein
VAIRTADTQLRLLPACAVVIDRPNFMPGQGRIFPIIRAAKSLGTLLPS